jgi:hypothetical protein
MGFQTAARGCAAGATPGMGITSICIHTRARIREEEKGSVLLNGHFDVDSSLALGGRSGRPTSVSSARVASGPRTDAKTRTGV